LDYDEICNQRVTEYITMSPKDELHQQQ